MMRLLRILLVACLLIAVPLEGWVALAMPLTGADSAGAAGHAAAAETPPGDCHGPAPIKGVCKASVFCSLCAGYVLPASLTLALPAANHDYAVATVSRHPLFVPEQPKRPPLA